MIKPTDPVTSDRVYDKYETEFLKEADKFRSEKRRAVTLSDAFHILRRMGYEKQCGFHFQATLRPAKRPAFVSGIRPAVSTCRRRAS